MSVLVTGHAVNVRGNVLVRSSMAVDTRLYSGVLDVTAHAVHSRMSGRMIDELLPGILVAEQARITGPNRAELDRSRSVRVVTCHAVSQFVTMFQFVTVRTSHGFGVCLVTGIAPVSEQWRFVTVRCRAQLVTQSIVACVLCCMFAAGFREVGILADMTVATANTGICCMCRMA